MQKINELTSMQYVIKSGDTLSEIVHSKYGKYDYKLLMSLAKYNNIQNVDKIVFPMHGRCRIGQTECGQGRTQFLSISYQIPPKCFKTPTISFRQQLSRISNF